MNQRIDRRFAALRAARRTGLVTFITAGDPGPQACPALMQALVRGGADFIELGVPFSDPMADGPVIQRSSERALAAGQTLKGVLEGVAEFRRGDDATPVVLMGYLNPIERMGYVEFARRAAAAGVDGVLIVDAPPEESAEVRAALGRHGLEQIFLIAPNTSEERIASICAAAGGFLYYVAVKGVTGDKRLDAGAIGGPVGRVRAHTQLPVAVGFGIKDPAAAGGIRGACDAVVVGSALVEIVARESGDVVATAAALQRFVAEFRGALDGAPPSAGDRMAGGKRLP